LEEDLKSPSLLLSGISEEAILRWMVLVLSVLIGGVAGLLSVIIAQVLMNFSNKYGRGDSTKFGGLVIVSFFYLAIIMFEGVSGALVSSFEVKVFLIYAFLVFVLGVVNEVFVNFTVSKLMLTYCVLSIVFLQFVPELSGALTAQNFINFEQSLVYTYLCIAFLLVSAIFSFYVSNGSSSLVPSLSVLIIIGISSYDLGVLGVFLSLAAVGSVIFLLFNVSIGQIYIGAGGSCFLGFLLGLAFIVLLEKPEVDVGYLLCIYFYPLVVFLGFVGRVCARWVRLDCGFVYFHDLVFSEFLRMPVTKKNAGAITGVLVSTVFAGIPVLIKNTDVNVNWLYFYLLMWVALIFLSAFILFRRRFFKF